MTCCELSYHHVRKRDGGICSMIQSTGSTTTVAGVVVATTSAFTINRNRGSNITQSHICDFSLLQSKICLQFAVVEIAILKKKLLGAEQLEMHLLMPFRRRERFPSLLSNKSSCHHHPSNIWSLSNHSKQAK